MINTASKFDQVEINDSGIDCIDIGVGRFRETGEIIPIEESAIGNVKPGIHEDIHSQPIEKIRKTDIGKKVLYRRIKIRQDMTIERMKGTIVSIDFDNPRLAEEGCIIWVKLDTLPTPVPLLQKDLAWHEKFFRVNKCVGLF